jgi:hypothetical protein
MEVVNCYAADFFPNHQHTRGEIALTVTTMPFKEYHCLLGHTNKHRERVNFGTIVVYY